MKHFFTLLALILTITFARAQCPNCAINYSYTTEGLYPDSFPDAIQNSAYDFDETFVMIPDTMGYTIYSFTISSVVGLPIGINWECSSSANGCVYDPSQSLYGCVKFCGNTPQVGVFNIVIYVVADVQLVGNVSIQFTKTLTVLPAGGGNGSFSFTPVSGCGSATVQFNGLINGAPNPTEWNWDFGNGNTSNQQYPPLQQYNTPGDYPVTLTTNIYNYALTQVDLYSCNENWCGDVEEPYVFGCTGDPDPFFEIHDAQGNIVYSVSYADDVSSASWTVNNVLMSNPPFTISFWDYDPVSQNDLLGTFAFNVNQTGNISFSSGDGTSASVTIGQVLNTSFFNVDTVHVYPFPSPPLVSLNGADTLCEGQTALLNCSTSSQNVIQWFKDAYPIPGGTNDSYAATASGTYFVTVTNQYGCSAASSLIPLYFAPNPPTPTFTINGNTLTCYLTGYSLQWFLNGFPIPGATNGAYNIAQSGNYDVCATDILGCTSCSDTLLLTLLGTEDASVMLRNFTVFPNPAADAFTVSFQLPEAGDAQLLITDATGRKIMEQKIISSPKQSSQTILSKDWASGIYFLQLITSRGTAEQSMIKE